MSDLKAHIDELTAIAAEFNLTRVKAKGIDENGKEWCIELESSPEFEETDSQEGTATKPATPKAKRRRLTPQAAPSSAPADLPLGTPISSPMTGVFYSSPSPGAPPFAKEGDTVQAGQVVGLIEAMKVFSEITATVSGTVTKVNVDNGKLVQPGDPLLYIN